MSDFKDKKDESMVDNSTVEENGDKKPKKHSNAKVMVRFLLGAVAVCMLVMIATGAWNPFKNYSADEKAVEIYEKSKKAEKNFFRAANKEADISSSGNSKYPNGFEVEDYGKDGENGCLKKTETSSGVYDMIYGLDWRTYYMKNNDYAKEKYSSLKSSVRVEGGEQVETETSNGYVYSYHMQAGLDCFIVKYDSTVYELWGAPENISKYQKWFDYMEIDYKVSTLEETQSK